MSKFFGGTNTGLQATARRLGLSTRQRELTDLSARLCSLPNELAVLEGAASALLALLPDAAASAWWWPIAPPSIYQSTIPLY